MGFATHLGPWLLGTNRYTTGTTAGTIRNTGATVVSQDKEVLFDDADNTVAFALPAGARVTGFQFITTTVFTAATTITLSIGGTAITGALTVTSAGVYNFVAATTLGATALWDNVGATDALVTYTVSQGASSAGAGTLVANYVVRGSDGATHPTSTQN